MAASKNNSQSRAEVTRLYQANHLQRVTNKYFYKATTQWDRSSSPRCYEYSILQAGSTRIAKVRKAGGGKLVVQRTWEDIRQDDNHYFSLIFLTKGKLLIEQNNATCVADSGCLAVGASNKPITGEVFDKGDYAEAYSLFVPSSEIHNYLPHIDKVCGQKMSLEDPAIELAKKTIIQLFEYGNRLPQHVIDNYISSSMYSLASALEPDCSRRIEEDNIKTVRLKSLQEYIDCHLAESGLTASLVAAQCGISTRYLHKLFKEEGISFHDYLWGSRLELAHDWLIHDKTRHQTIEKIAYLSGFSTAAHFGRVFKSKYGYTPSEARNRVG